MTVKEIKQYIKNNKITYFEISKKSGIPESTLKSIFSERTKNPRIDTINAIQAALELDQDTIQPQKLNPTLDSLVQKIKKLPPDKQQTLISSIDNIIKLIE